MKPKQRSILILTHVLVLLLPLAGIGVLRLYENALILQTQTELVTQGSVMAAVFAERAKDVQDAADPYKGYPLAAMPNEYRERVPKPLDLFRLNIPPPIAEAVSPTVKPHPVALKIGRAMARVIDASKHNTLSGTRAIDTAGNILASSNDGDAGLNVLHLEEVQTALNGAPVAVLRERLPDPVNPNPKHTSLSRGARKRLYVCLPVYGKNEVIGAIMLWRTPLDVPKALYEKRYVIIASLGLFLALAILISVISSYFVTRPLSKMIRQAEKLAANRKDWNAEPPAAVTEEVMRLEEAFGTMAETLEKRGEYIKQFAMHVSHEFKTPLSSLRGAIELLQDHWDTMPLEKRAKFLENIAGDTSRLDRLVGRLMELAHAEVAQTSPDSSDPWALAYALQEKFKDQGLKVTVKQGDPALRAAVPAEVLDAVFVNLLGNSLQHGAKSVDLEFSRAGLRFEALFRDDGPGISEANAEKVFTPFFTTGRAKGGTGLGLTITKTMLETYQGSIEFIPSSQGATFKVSIPSAK